MTLERARQKSHLGIVLVMGLHKASRDQRSFFIKHFLLLRLDTRAKERKELWLSQSIQALMDQQHYDDFKS